MTETLYIRLGSQAQDTIHWLIMTNTNGGEAEIIASGELQGAEQLTELSAKAEQRPVHVFVPGCDVLLKRLTVPAKSNKAMRMAVPYMLEDEFAEEVEQLFFAYADLPADDAGHNCFAAIVAHQQIQQWLSWLSEADIVIKSMLPDTLAMPYNEESWSAISLGEHSEQQVIVRQGLWQGYTLDKSAWELQCELISQELIEAEDEEGEAAEQVSIAAYSPLAYSEKVNLTSMPEELPLALLATNKNSELKRFNLIQGEYKVKEKRSYAGQQWLWVAGIALFALLLNLGNKTLKLWQINSAQEVVQEEIIKSYKTAFPKTKKVRVSTIKSQLNRELALLGGASDGHGFLSMLAKVQPGFAKVTALKPETLKFDGKRQELRIQAKAKDYQAFEQFTQALSNSDLSVKLGSQNSKDGEVTGSFVITNKSQRKSSSGKRSKRTRGAS